jgi:2-methylcitrate dehydratase
MEVVEDQRYSREYHEPDKRSIANAIQIFFKDGSSTDKIEIEYPIGHRRRRAEGMPVLVAKFRDALASRFPESQAKAILALCEDTARLERTPVHEFMSQLVI